MNKTRIIMVLVAITLAMSVASATDWQQFQKDEKNSGWTPDSAPQTAPVFEPDGSWRHGLPTAGFSAIDSTPIVVGDFVYVLTADTSNTYLYKFHKDGSGSGWTDNRAQVGNLGMHQVSTPASDGSTIFVANNKVATAGICAVDIATGTLNWGPILVTDGGNYAQANTPILHHEGRIFFGTTYGTTNKYYCYWANNGTRCWDRTCPGGGGYYWAGGAIIGDYLVFGDEHDILTSVYWCDGTPKDTLDVTTLPYSDGTPRTIRSSVIWDGASSIYFTDKQPDGNAWKVGFNAATGTFDTSAGAGWRNPVGYTTSTPVVYDGRVYVGQGGFGASGNLYCLNAATGATIWTFTPNGGIQSSPAISTAGGEIHAYFTTNCQQGRAYCVEDNGATGDEVWHFETDESGTSGGYMLQGCAVSDGWAFFGNDGGGFYGLTDSSIVTAPDLDVTAINHDTIYSDTYNIITATVENIGNGDAGTFNVTLGDSSSGTVDEVTVTGLAHGASTEVKLLWTPDPINYQLTVTADSNDEVDESDESNNVMTTVVYPIPVPPTDLIVTEVCDGDLFVNEDNVVFAVIENNGADASGFSVSLEVGGVEKDKVFVPMLYFRDSQIVTLSWTPTSTGNVQLDVTVDCDGQITESNEANNVASQNVGVVNPTVTTVSTIGALQAAASSGTNKKIVVNAGTYNGQVTIPTACSGIRLIANGAVTIADNTGDIVTVEGENCYVSGFQINGSWNGDTWPSWSSAGVNVTSDWNVVEDNYIYNTSGGIKLSGSKNLIKCNTVGDSALARACAKLMVTSGDLNAIVKNKFDGDTGYHGDHYGWVLGGIFTIAGVIEAEATNNLVRDNNFTITGVPGATQFWPPGSLCFGGDPNLVFNNIINDTDPNMIWLGRLNWYGVDKVAVEDPKCGNVVHGPYYGGNHWLGYTGSDNDQDLLGDTDTPYRGYDVHPLVKAKCGDATCNGVVNPGDATRIKSHLNMPTMFPLKCAWAADVAGGCNGVNPGDATRIKSHLNMPTMFPLTCCECGC